MSDNVYHPNHYVLNSVKMEPVELTARVPSAIGQAINYVMRSRFKGTYKEDIEKAINYLNIQLGMKDMFSVESREGYLYHFNSDTNKVRVAVVWAFRNFYKAPTPAPSTLLVPMEEAFLRTLFDERYNITRKSIEEAIKVLEDVRDDVYDEAEQEPVGGTE